MQRGAFRYMRHEHYFEAQGTGTLMHDVFEFASPLGGLGQLVDTLVLKRYLRRFLEERAHVVQQYAETDKWREILP